MDTSLSEKEIACALGEGRRRMLEFVSPGEAARRGGDLNEKGL